MRLNNALPLIVAILPLLAPTWSWAHRLDAAASYVDGALVIEAWFADGSPASESEVTISDEEGAALVIGEMDANGFYRWPVDEPLALNVNVYAGLGHNQTLSFTREEMVSIMALAETPATQETPPRGGGSARERGAAAISTQDRFGAPERVVLGMTFILAAAAAWLSYRNSERLRVIQERLANRDDQR